MIDHGRRALTRLGLHASLGLGLLGAVAQATAQTVRITAGCHGFTAPY